MTENLLLLLLLKEQNLQICEFNIQLADIVYECNYTYHSTNKMKPADIKLRTYIDFVVKIMKKILNLKLFIVPCTYVISDLNGEEIVRTLYE